MTKNYAKDTETNKILSTTANIKQMNFFEYVYHRFVSWNELKTVSSFAKATLEAGWEFIIRLSQLVVYPIFVLPAMLIKYCKVKNEGR